MTDDPHQLAAAYALDAVEPEEARRFEAHLQSCPRCAAEVADFHATAAQLAGAAATPPPTAMRDRVLARAAITRQQSPHVRRSSPARRLAPLLAAAVVLAAVLGVGLTVRDLAAERDQARELAAVLAAPDARFATLDGEQPGPTVRVVWSPSNQAAVLIGADLAEPGPGRTYELWALADDGPHSAGVFDPDTDGRVEQRLALPAEPTGGWGITIEPEGGSPRPTGEILFVGA
jgi:anti-sigma-K factor RskA